MSRGWKTTIVVAALAGIISTPLLWLLGSRDASEMVGASIQAATSIIALIWMLAESTSSRRRRPSRQRPKDAAVDTGRAEAVDGGTAQTGVRRPGGRGGGSAQAMRTGDATAQGPGSRATSGVDYGS